MESKMPSWTKWFVDRIGWTEFNHDHELSRYWKVLGINYHTVIGTEHAWCGLALAGALHDNGIAFPKGAAGAKNWQGFGIPCGWISGAILPMRHLNGGHHVTQFLYWHDVKNKIAACLGGNQSNAIKIALYNLSGNAHGQNEIVTGPRWPKGIAQTGFVYPRSGKVSTGGSTRFAPIDTGDESTLTEASTDREGTVTKKKSVKKVAIKKKAVKKTSLKKAAGKKKPALKKKAVKRTKPVSAEKLG